MRPSESRRRAAAIAKRLLVVRPRVELVIQPLVGARSWAQMIGRGDRRRPSLLRRVWRRVARVFRRPSG